MNQQTTTAAAIRIRWMAFCDHKAVVEIDSDNDFGWSEELVVYHARKTDVIGMVAEYGEKVVGFMVYALGTTAFGLLNFAVHPEWRRLGIGRQMLAKLVAKMSPGRRTRVTVNVHESNLGMQLFLRECGFRAICINGNFYRFVLRFGDESAKRVAELMGE